MKKYLFLNRGLYAAYIVLMIASAALGTGFAFVLSSLLDCAVTGNYSTLPGMIIIMLVLAAATVFIMKRLAKPIEASAEK